MVFRKIGYKISLMALDKAVHSGSKVVQKSPPKIFIAVLPIKNYLYPQGGVPFTPPCLEEVTK